MEKLSFTRTTIVIIAAALLVIGAIWYGQIKQNSISLKLTSPNGGEKWETEKSYWIEWTTNLGKGTEGHTMVVSLIQVGYGAKILFDNLASDAPTEYRVNWKIPKDINPGSYIISITAYGSQGTTVIDASDTPFDIITSAGT